MNQEIFKKIEINDTMSLEFWNSETQIKNYCDGILSHSGSDCKVTVRFSGTDAYVTTADKKNFSITLPKTELIVDDNLKLKNIIARTVFLRHELAHVLFTDFNLQDQVTSNGRVFNMFDDARIENLYSRKYKGTYRLFGALIKNIYNHDKNKLFIAHANIEDFSMYCRVREKGITPVIKNMALESLYGSLYKKYRYIFHNDYQILIDGVKAIIKDFEEIEQDRKDAEQKEQEQEQEETQQEETEPAEPEQTDEDETSETDDQTEQEPEEEDGEGSESDSDEEDEESGQADAEEETDESGDEQSDEDDTETSGGSGDEEETDELQEMVDKVFSDVGGDTEEPSLDYAKILKDVAETKTTFDMDKYTFDPKDFKEAEVIEFDKISRYVMAQIETVKKGYKRTKNGPKEFRRVRSKTISFNLPDAQNIYNSIVSQHKKTIVETINYLKLKLKIRTNDRILRHQIDGKLDQKNLKDILVNKNMPEVFYRAIKSLKTDSAFYFLIDFSSSMGSAEKKDAMVCCIILTEICKALNISYEIGLFASTYASIFPVANMENAELVKNILSKNKNKIVQISTNGKRKHSVILKHNDNDTNVVYRLKSIRDKHSAAAEQLLANVHSCPNILTGGTPEFESFLTIINGNKNKNTKKHVFIINDGMINSIKEVAQLEHNRIFNHHRLSYSIDEKMLKLYSKEKLTEILFTELKMALTGSQSVFEQNDWNIRYDSLTKRYDKYSMDVYNQYLEILNNPSKHTYIIDMFKKDEARRLPNLPPDTELKLDLGKFFPHGWEYFGVDSRNIESVEIYRKAIEYAEKNGFDVHGFGIRSSYGKKYLGKEFQVFENSKDIENSFAAKIRAIF